MTSVVVTSVVVTSVVVTSVIVTSAQCKFKLYEIKKSLILLSGIFRFSYFLD